MVSTFNIPSIKKKLYNISDCWSEDMLSLDFLYKGLELASPPYNIYHVIFSCYILGASTSWNIGRYVYNNYLLSSLWCHKVFLLNQKVRAKMLVSQEQKQLLTWNKKHFLSFIKGFSFIEVHKKIGRWEPHVHFFKMPVFCSV